MRPKLILVSVASDDPKATSEFYSQLLGIEFARSFSDAYPAYHAPIHGDGTLLQVQKRFQPNEGVICYFAVENLQETIAALTSKGAKLTGDPRDLPVSKQVLDDYKEHYRKSFGEEAASTVGQGAMLTDPAGNEFGLIELDKHAHVMFKVGRHTDPKNSVSEEQLAIHRRTASIGAKIR